LFRITRFRSLFRTVYFLPYVTSAVAAATVWRVLLRPQSGFVNVMLVSVGLEPQKWLIEPRSVFHLITGGAIPADVGPSLALCCIIAFDIWHSSGFMIVVFLAGLSAIPRQLEETARLDGASTFGVVRYVTIPLLSPTIFFLVIVSAIKSFQAFNSFYALVNARGEDTQNLIVYIYAQFYENQHIGYGASIAVIMCVAIVLLTIAQWRIAGRQVYYE
ncbi:MAG TPA: sugar ABC transporter permease, partial [Candidatus Hydrogenedentes bacterium]|nr:sugar ABC transporter permease [Candidatus Hydrogenedentota bacterium]